MSLPRFFRGLQMKRPLPSSQSDLILSDASNTSSSSSASSGPKDALGFPLPVSITMTTAIATDAASFSSSSASTTIAESSSPTGIDAVDAMDAAHSCKETAPDEKKYAHETAQGTPKDGANGHSEGTVPVSVSVSASASLSESVSAVLAPPPSAVDPVQIHGREDAPPILWSPPSPCPGDLLPVPVPVPLPSQPRLRRPSPSGTGYTADNASIPVVHIISPTKTRPPQPLYPPPPPPPIHSSSVLDSGAATFNENPTSANATTFNETPTTADATAVAHQIELSGSPANSSGRQRDKEQPADLLAEQQGRHPQGARVRSNAIIQTLSPTATTQEYDHLLAQQKALSKPSTRSRSASSSFTTADPSSPPPPVPPSVPPAPPSVAVQKGKQPKSILRSRSKSQPLPPSEYSQDSWIPAFPVPPLRDTRLSVSSDTSSISRTSVYLLQDPMGDLGQEDSRIATTETLSTQRSRRASSGSTHSRLSGTYTTGTSTNSSPTPISSTDILSRSDNQPRHTFMSTSIPVPPHSPSPSLYAPVDEHSNLNVSLRRQSDDTLDPAPSSHNLLSFPSLNDYKASGSMPTPTANTNLAPTPTPQNYTPLTLKSVRLAKSRSKLRQDPDIGVATGIRRNSSPKNAISSTAPPSISGNGPGLEDSVVDSTPLTLLPADNIPPASNSVSRHRESSISSTIGYSISPSTPRPILKDTSARDKALRESWMSEPPGAALAGTMSSAPTRLSGVPLSTPVAPPKSLARNNSSRRQSRLSRMSAMEYDQDALTPRPRNLPTGYGPDYRPRRQSGGPGHLLYAFDNSASSVDMESEDYDDSDADEGQSHSKHLQEQYLRMQKSQLRQSALEIPAGSAQSRSGTGAHSGDEGYYFETRAQRKSLGDELNLPPVPEKSTQRKRVSTVDAATLPAVSSSFSSALAAASSSATSATETLSSIIRSNTTLAKDRRPQGALGHNSLSFEPLFALKDAGTKAGAADEQQHLPPQFAEPSSSRHSAISDSEWITTPKPLDPSQKDVAILDLSKRELFEIPTGLPASISHLRLAYNSIQTILPIVNLTGLSNLQMLDLCDNGLELLPSELGRLTKLKELYLSNNKLRKLPDAIQKMASLEVLDVRNNDFYLLNPALGRLKSLRQLDVRSNKLKSLPATFCMLSSTLTVLLVDGNQFVEPFSDLLQPLMLDDTGSTISEQQGFLGDDPYGDSHRGRDQPTMRSVGGYEPWRRTITPVPSRRAPVLTKRRSHGDLMTMIGLQKKESVDSFDVGNVEPYMKASTISASTGGYLAASLSENSVGRRERSVSTSGLVPTTNHHEEHPVPSLSSPSTGSLSLNRFLKSIRKSSRSSLKDGPSSASKVEHSANRIFIAGEADSVLDGDLEAETKQTSRGSESAMSTQGKRAPSGGINQWVRDRLHKRTNSSEQGVYGSSGFMAMDSQEQDHSVTVRDSGYGSVGHNIGASDSSITLNARGSGMLGLRYQNKSTGHLPAGPPLSPRDSQLSASFDPSRKDRGNRLSYMSMDSQLTLGTEREFDFADTEAAIAHQQQQQLQQQQFHRLSSMHSPTTPLPSSPVMNGMAGVGSWGSHSARNQVATYIKPLMRYLKDLYDLDTDSSEWEEVYAWRRVWNAERSPTADAPEPKSKDSEKEDTEGNGADLAERAAKEEEIRLAKLQAQAARRRRIVDEIMTTERTYVEGLKGLVEIYLTPALSVMPPSDHKAVFSNAQGICNFHADHFLPELEKAYHVQEEQIALESARKAKQSAEDQTGPESTQVQSESPEPSAASAQTTDQASNVASEAESKAVSTSAASDTVAAHDGNKIVVEDRIGRVFAEHVAYMKMYSFYINNFDNALRVLQTQLTVAKHKKKMKEFLRRCAKHPKHTQLALQGYLLLPVQRIPRYKLLLQDLLENTWRGHVDYQDIATALEQISSRADEMNERKRQYENHEKVLLVQNRILGQYKTPLVQPHRKVVREGMLHLIRVVTRNVSMAETLEGPSASSGRPLSGSSLHPVTASSNNSSNNVGDLTVHYLSEELVEKSFLFILFNDILIQCNHVVATGKSSSSLAATAAGTNAGSVSGSGAGSAMSPSAGSGTSAAGASGSGDASSGKNLELCRVLQLESRLHPAEVIGQDVLRVVDDAMVLYLTGDKDVVQSWKEDINSRW